MLYLTHMGLAFIDSFVRESRPRIFKKQLVIQSAVLDVSVALDFTRSVRFCFEKDYYVILCSSDNVGITLRSVDTIKGTYCENKLKDTLDRGLCLRFKKPILSLYPSVSRLCMGTSIVLFFVDTDTSKCYTLFNDGYGSSSRYIRNDLGRDRDWVSHLGSFLGKSDILSDCFDLITVGGVRVG